MTLYIVLIVQIHKLVEFETDTSPRLWYIIVLFHKLVEFGIYTVLFYHVLRLI